MPGNDGTGETQMLRLCMRVQDMPDPVLAGTVIRNCDRCGASVWVDPLQSHDYGHLREVRVCIPCARLDPELAPDVRWLENNTEEVRRELAKALRDRKGRRR